MKKLLECIRLFSGCKKAVWLCIFHIISTTLYLGVDAMLLMWIMEGLDNATDPFHSILKVAVGVGLVCIFGYYRTCLRKLYLNEAMSHLQHLYIDKILNCEYKMFVKYSPTKIVVVGEEINKLVGTIDLMVKILTSIANVSITMVAIAKLDITAVVPVIVLYAVSTPVMRKFFTLHEKINVKFRELALARRNEFSEVINGFADVRSFQTQSHHKESIYKKIADLKSVSLCKARMTATFDNVIEVIIYVPTMVVMYIAMTKIRSGIITGACGVSLVMYVQRLIYPLISILDSISEFSDMTVHLDDYLEIIRYKDGMEDGKIELMDFENEIRFENVSFSYDESDMVLQNIDLSIKKGEKIGICGGSGGGKSTLLKLLPRFYDSYSGAIRIDGIDTKELTANSLRSHISIVHQDIHILDGTIYENIQYGNWNATEHEVMEACKRADIYDFILSLPEKFNTKVGPNGMKLSGGQKQRIALARVFLSQSDIVLLDEATSALDNETENFIQDALSKFLNDKTVIIVAHRLTTIRDCDKIVVIDNHTVAEQGTHAELMSRRGKYYALSSCKESAQLNKSPGNIVAPEQFRLA